MTLKAEWTNRDNLSIETTGQNSKAILVIDMPNNCEECDITYFQGHGESSICYSGDWSKRPSWCPLRPMPQKVELDINEYYKGMADG